MLTFDRCRQALEMYLRQFILNPQILHSASLRCFLEPPNDPSSVKKREGTLQDLFFLPPPPSTIFIPVTLKLNDLSSLPEKSTKRSQKNSSSTQGESTKMKKQYKEITFEMLPEVNSNINEDESLIIPPLDEESFTPLFNEHTEHITEESNSNLPSPSSDFSVSISAALSRMEKSENNDPRLWQSSHESHPSSSPSGSKQTKETNKTTEPVPEDNDKDMIFLHLLIESVRDHLEWTSLLKISVDTKQLTNRLELLLKTFNSDKVVAMKESLVKEKDMLQVITSFHFVRHSRQRRKSCFRD
jgi:hypothetical protein